MITSLSWLRASGLDSPDEPDRDPLPSGASSRAQGGPTVQPLRNSAIRRNLIGFRRPLRLVRLFAATLLGAGLLVGLGSAEHATATATAPDSGQFVPLSTSRVFDTSMGSVTDKLPDGTVVMTQPEGALQPGQIMNYDFLGHGGVPSSGVLAVVLHVTTSEGGAAGSSNPWGGYVWAYSATNGTAVPTLSNDPHPSTEDSVVNSNDTLHADNTSIVELGDDGQVSFYDGSGADAVDVAVDVEGYVTNSDSGSAGGTYAPLTPYRELNDYPLASGVTHWDQIVGTGASGGADVPAEASQVDAVAINLTASNSTSNCSVAATPADASDPNAAQKVHAYTGAPASQLVVTTLSPAGGIFLSTDCDSVDVSVDLEGYYLPASSGGTGDVYVPVDPDRIVDTRSGLGISGTLAANSHEWGDDSVPITGVGGVPSTNVDAVALSFQSLNTQPYPTSTGSGHGYVTAWAKGATQPTNVQTVGADAKVDESNLAFIQPSSIGEIDLYNSSGETTDLTIDIEGYFAVPTVPSTPQDVSATPARSGSATVSWDPPVSDGSAAITQYVVTQEPGGAKVTTNGETLTGTFDADNDAISYSYSVVATNALGTSNAGNSGSPLTPDEPIRPVLSGGFFSQVVSGSTSASLSSVSGWAASDTAAVVSISCSSSAAASISVAGAQYSIAAAPVACSSGAGVPDTSTVTIPIDASGNLITTSNGAAATVTMSLLGLVGPSGTLQYEPMPAGSAIVDTSSGLPTPSLTPGQSFSVIADPDSTGSPNLKGYLVDVSGTAQSSGTLSVGDGSAAPVTALSLSETQSTNEVPVFTTASSLTFTDTGANSAQVTATVVGEFFSPPSDTSESSPADTYQPISATTVSSSPIAVPANGSINVEAGAVDGAVNADAAVLALSSNSPSSATIAFSPDEADASNANDPTEGNESVSVPSSGGVTIVTEQLDANGDIAIDNGSTNGASVSISVLGYWLSPPLDDVTTGATPAPSTQDLQTLVSDMNSDLSADNQADASMQAIEDPSLEGDSCDPDPSPSSPSSFCVNEIDPGELPYASDDSYQQASSRAQAATDSLLQQTPDISDDDESQGLLEGTSNAANSYTVPDPGVTLASSPPRQDSSDNLTDDTGIQMASKILQADGQEAACQKSDENGGEIVAYTRMSTCEQSGVKLSLGEYYGATGFIYFLLSQYITVRPQSRWAHYAYSLVETEATGAAVGSCWSLATSIDSTTGSRTVKDPFPNNPNEICDSGGDDVIGQEFKIDTNVESVLPGTRDWEPEWAIHFHWTDPTDEYVNEDGSADYTYPSATRNMVRCDSVGYFYRRGCSVYLYRPTIVFPLSGGACSCAKAAAFYAQVQRLTGLGAYGSPLSRWVGTAKDRRTARNQACRAIQPVPTGDSCDEYPFNATYQNPAINPLGQVRPIPLDQNRRAGAKYAGFINRWRILNGDKFYVDFE